MNELCDCGCGRRAVLELLGLAWSWLCAWERFGHTEALGEADA